MPITIDPSRTPQFVGHANILASYCIPKTTTVEPAPATNVTSPAPLASIVTQGPPPGIPMYSAMEVIDQVESMNLTVILEQELEIYLSPRLYRFPVHSTIPHLRRDVDHLVGRPGQEIPTSAVDSAQ
uniref:Uncharacterized protein n=1 Tax=Romanomermis culicivorax TaxID=13658 RepID=A0A915J2T9_ROMCU